MFKEQIVGGSVTLNAQAPPRANAAAFYARNTNNGVLLTANNTFCCDAAVESCKDG